MRIVRTKSAGGVVVNKKRGLIVVNQNFASWSLPKGHVENGESEIEAAKREIKEETGVSKLEFVKELGRYERFRMGRKPLERGNDKSELKEIVMFLFLTEEERLNPEDRNNPEARWVSFEGAVGMLTHPKDREFLKRVEKDVAPFLSQ